MTDYLVSILTFAGLYGLMALGLNIAWGMAGMINLGLVGFFALGAYASALLTVKAGAPIALGVLAAVAFSAACGVIVALVTARLRDDYLAIVTLGFAEVIRIVASNEIWLTKGTDGISGIPGPLRGQVAPATFNTIYLVIVLAVVVAIVWMFQNVFRSPFGRVLRAIRDDPQVAAVAGKWVLRFKVQAFALSAAILGLAGALYGHYTSYVAPDVFVPLLTLNIVLALSLGGLGNNIGALLGALLIVAFQESARFVGSTPALEATQVAALREFVIAVGLLVVLRWRPQGILPERSPRWIRPLPDAAIEDVHAPSAGA
ncbi:MAG TPA: branched-chain amino acid ABC transporter permease [bacterium]|nr:branched-chain amino acid ABC transporter permease [bacterium]